VLQPEYDMHDARITACYDAAHRHSQEFLKCYTLPFVPPAAPET